VAILGPKTATGAWHDHFRVWRKRRLRQVEREYGDKLDEVADFLADFAAKIKAVGPKTYLESMAYNERDAKRDRQKSSMSSIEIAVADGPLACVHGGGDRDNAELVEGLSKERTRDSNVRRHPAPVPSGEGRVPDEAHPC
jgi:hypothetical protein